MPNNPQLIVVEATPTGTGASIGFSLVCATPGVVVKGGTELDLGQINKPVYILVKLMNAAGLRLLATPADAAWFGHGTGKPTGPGTAGGHFQPEAVSYGGDALLFRANGPDGPGPEAGHAPPQFALLLRFQSSTTGGTQQAGTTTLAAAAISGGPIIIND